MAGSARSWLRLAASTAWAQAAAKEREQVEANDGARRWRRILAWLFGFAALALVGAVVPPTAGATTMPRISVRGDRLYSAERPWRAWGMNWGVADHEPVIAYFDDPTRAKLSVLRGELRSARSMGANSMRIYLQLGQVMATPTRVRTATLIALRRLLALAQSDGIYLDITGDLVWRPTRAPAWYRRLGRQGRWSVQGLFWKAVATAASSSPAVLCYELTSEPIIAQTRAHYYGRMGNWWFQQSIATASPRDAARLARSWTRLLAGAVRSEDDRPVTIGLLPNSTGPFSPANVGDALDMLTVHEYPATGQASAAIALIRLFARYRKPVLLGETSMLMDDAGTQGRFLTASAPFLSGAFEFFDGRNPANIRVHSVYDGVYEVGLDQFRCLRGRILSGD